MTNEYKQVLDAERKETLEWLSKYHSLSKPVIPQDMVNFLTWLSLDHNVDTSTKARSDYWANQFRLASKQAAVLLKSYLKDQQ